MKDVFLEQLSAEKAELQFSLGVMSLETTFPGEPTVMTSASVWGAQACSPIPEGKHATFMRTSTRPAYPTWTPFTDPTGDSCLQGLSTTVPLLG